ncbi:reverse transcriptase domain-containing protein [Bacillus spongiae]|uniref:Reverse transcriptase domain-containing protein n=1 Tax=Bacillus spongiae TaxID=2683610 RepID=A0ABU8H8Q9_9BACI
MASNPFQQLAVIRKASQKGYTITDCYRLMYKKELWMKAYAKLSPNAEKLSKGEPEERIDSSGMQDINEIINHLKTERFRFVTGERVRTNVRKKDVFFSEQKNRLVQEVMRMILESVFEPTFSNNSHGFREGRDNHTALSQIQKTWTMVTWCIEGKIKGLFDHSMLIYLISKKINDRRFLLLIHNALTCGVIENWNDSGTSQVGNISPILANIYLHEFDSFIDKQIKFSNCNRVGQKYQKIKFIRYVDDFVIGISGSKKCALWVKEEISCFLKKELRLQLRTDRAIITHLEKPVPFLGYQFRRRKREKNNVNFRNQLRNPIVLEIPKRKIKAFAVNHGYGNLNDFTFVHRANLMNHSEVDILTTYNRELRGIANYYMLANNYQHLEKLFNLAQSSFIKTIANKRKSTFKKVILSMRKPKQGYLSILGKDKQGNEQLSFFVKLNDLQGRK